MKGDREEEIRVLETTGGEISHAEVILIVTHVERVNKEEYGERERSRELKP